MSALSYDSYNDSIRVPIFDVRRPYAVQFASEKERRHVAPVVAGWRVTSVVESLLSNVKQKVL